MGIFCVRARNFQICGTLIREYGKEEVKIFVKVALRCLMDWLEGFRKWDQVVFNEVCVVNLVMFVRKL
jgi:hypothetical protein